MISILYVDDERYLLDLAKEFLELDGDMQVDTVISAQDALEKLTARNYDLILSDYQMPGMDGIALLKVLQARGSTVPFILYTGRGREEVVIEAINNGATSYLQKGGDAKAQFAELSHKIRHAVEKRRAELALQDSERRFRAIIDQSTGFVGLMATDGSLLEINKTALDFIGAPESEMLGKPFWETPWWRHSPQLQEDVRRAVGAAAGGESVRFEATHIAVSGEVAFVDFSIKPVRNNHGEIVYLIPEGHDITRRKKAEDAMDKGRQQLHEIVQGSPVPTFVIDKNHRIISWNRALAEYSGVSEEEVMGTKDAWRAFYPEQHQTLADLIVDGKADRGAPFYGGNYSRSTLVPGGYESTDFFPRMKAHGVWLFFTASPLHDAEGNIIGAIETLQDITVQKQREVELAAAYEQMQAAFEEAKAGEDALQEQQARLLESEERYRTVVETQTEFICRFRPDGIHIFVNEAYCRYFGKRADEIIGHRFIPVVPAEERTLVKTHFASLTPGHPDGIMEHRIILPGGMERWQEWNDHAVFDAHGNVVEYQSVGRDITARKRSELDLAARNQELAAANEQLAAVEEELRSNLDELVESRKDLEESEELHRTIFETVPEGIALTDTSGILTYASPAALRLFGLSSPEEALGTAIFDWIEPGTREEVRSRVLRFIGSGSKGIVSGINPARKRDGTLFFAEVTSTLLFHADGTPRGMISILHDVTDRMARQDALKRTTAKLNLLSAVTRHDLLNQLTVLMGYIELSRQAKEPQVIQDFLKKLDMVAGTLRDQTEFTKDYQDLGVKSPQWQSLARVCSDAVSQLDLGPVQVICEAGNLELYADPLFGKVIYNIIDNALRYGGPVTTIRIAHRLENGDLSWSVEDDGVGIPAKNKSLIFNKGFGSHTGFGLFLAREILSITGMSIMETGFPGKGARFEIIVPRGMFRFGAA